MEYQPKVIEQKWKKYWEEHQIYKVDIDANKPKYYVLDMFPYPSGAGLHVGHPLGYVASDIYARYKRLKGFNVLHPMGYDAFGLPAEQYAIQTGVHPADSTAENVQRYRQQLDNLGFSFDWSRKITTCEPDYYKWTQTIFLKLFGHYYDNIANQAKPIAELVAVFEKEGNEHVQAATTQERVFSAEEWQNFSNKEQDDILMNYRLAYRKMGFVNWCEELGTVLANDEVKDGVSERGGFPVVKKPMRQWALRITAYAQRLLDGLEGVEFSEALKAQQRNWIGRSEGARILFQVENHAANPIEVFTTRPDTIFGATFMVLAPEHDLVDQITTVEQKTAIAEYKKYAQSRSERDRMTEVKKVTGAFTGAYAINPFTNTKIPIWISDYVLIGYGTGAIMAVPSGDERDQRFAQHFGIDIIEVVDQSKHEGAGIQDKVGVMINSGFMNGLSVLDAIQAAITKINELKIGQGLINYRLRDANFSRQRYWGEPFPISYTEEGVAVAEQNLPLELPKLDNFKPTKDGQSPLARATEWVKTNNGLTRELDTMPGYAGSSWYFLRYMDANNKEEMFSKEAVNYWQDVDLYVGGAEHAVGHLLYSRFWHKFMYDIGQVPTKEPYKKLINQGMIQGVIEFLYLLKEKRDGKSVFVSADKLENYEGQEFAKIPVHINFVSEYGSDKSFLNAEGIQQFIEWRSDYKEAIFEVNENGQLITESEVGKMSKRYFNVVNPDDVVAEYGTDCFRLYEMFLGPLEQAKPWDMKGITGVAKFLRKLWGLFYKDGQLVVTEDKPNNKELKALHATIKRTKHGLETFSFNTCVSDFMKLTNDLKDLKCSKRAILEPFLVLMAPFAPFITEALWAALGNASSIHVNGVYPTHNEEYLKVSEIKYPIQIGKKVRAHASFSVEATKEEIEASVLEMDEVKEYVGSTGKTIKRVVVVPKRIINIVL